MVIRATLSASFFLPVAEFQSPETVEWEIGKETNYRRGCEKKISHVPIMYAYQRFLVYSANS